MVDFGFTRWISLGLAVLFFGLMAPNATSAISIDALERKVGAKIFDALDNKLAGGTSVDNLPFGLVGFREAFHGASASGAFQASFVGLAGSLMGIGGIGGAAALLEGPGGDNKRHVAGSRLEIDFTVATDAFYAFLAGVGAVGPGASAKFFLKDLTTNTIIHKIQHNALIAAAGNLMAGHQYRLLIRSKVDQYTNVPFESGALWGLLFAVEDNVTLATPEPSTLLLLGSGLVGLVAYRRRRAA